MKEEIFCNHETHSGERWTKHYWIKAKQAESVYELRGVKKKKSMTREIELIDDLMPFS